MQTVPFQVIDQLIQCFGKCFHYKDVLESFLIACGVPSVLARKYKDEAKFVWGRKLLNELNTTEDGIDMIKAILTSFNKLKNIPDQSVVDVSSGLSALRVLKEIILEHKIITAEEKAKVIDRRTLSNEKTKIILQRQERLKILKNELSGGMISVDRQKVGYDLEDIIKELFSLHEIDYRKSYKTDTQQIDGHFRFQGFDYLVEAKWRKGQPTESEIGSFQRKVNSKLQSTRGLFVSVTGFRKEVLEAFNGANNIIMFCGMDLINVLDGRVDLKELLEYKIKNAAQYGVCYSPSTDLL